MMVHERLLRTVPQYAEARAQSETRLWQHANRMISAGRSGITVIPVVVHVVYKTAAQNISDAQIHSQIDVLNRDFRKLNTDVSNTPAVFQPLCADARIEFQLATTDPSGGASAGITRTQTTADQFVDDDKVKSAASGGADAWPADKYLNLWVCQLGNSLLGYAQFPGGPAATDGVVILHSGFGTTGTATAPFNLGRSATHEIGHWLNLHHIWGDDGTGCGGDDLVADTPNAAGPNFGKPAFPHVTCSNGPNGDLFMNYMDYSDDGAMFMFTQGQVARMQVTLDGDRSSIGHTKAGPTLAFADLHPTLLSIDVHPTAAWIDHVGTLATHDIHPTVSWVDVIKQPFLDKPPFADVVKHPASDGGPHIPFHPGDPAPFVLATPHHTMAWRSSFPDVAQAAASGLQQQANEYELLLKQYADAEAAGELSAADAAAAEQLYVSYQQLLAEHGQLTGG
jgi:hypothetical protein